MNRLPPHKVNRIRSHYSRRVAPDRENYDILDWGCREAQEARFDVLLRAIAALQPSVSSPFSLLDVGCGMTDLATYLETRHGNDHCRYVGVDITWEILSEAARRFPGRRILQGDVFGAAPFLPGSFDAVFCSGVFNLRLGNNADFALRAIPQLAAQSRRLVVANFLHVRTSRKYAHCYYFDPEWLTGKLAGTCRRMTVVDDYLENDFSLIVIP